MTIHDRIGNGDPISKLLACCSLGTLHSIREDVWRWMSEIESVVIEHDVPQEQEWYQTVSDILTETIQESE